jgi:signal transduction histidine kinase
VGQAFDTLFPLSSSAFTVEASEALAEIQPEALLTRVLKGETLTGNEVQLQKLHADPVQLLLSAGPLWGAEQQIIGCVVTMVDISIRKQAEMTLRRSQEELERLVSEQIIELRQRERLAVIGSTTAKLAHEIGNPLNAVFTTLQLFERSLAASPEACMEIMTQTLPGVRNEVARLQNLLQDLRQVTRPQSLSRQPVNPDLVINDILRVHAPAYTVQGICVVEELQNQSQLVSVDTHKFAQVVLNLYKNAVEAMPQGGLLTVRSSCDHGSYCLEVQDTGPGIPDGLHIFEPFATTKSEGTGLGLPIVKQIVEAHDGRIDYTNVMEEECGARFTIRLPLG